MGRMSTKARPVNPSKAVRAYIEHIFHDSRMRVFSSLATEPFTVPFHETWVWEEVPIWSDPHHTIVTCHGKTHVGHGWARYEGKYGIWVVDLVSERGESKKDYPACSKVWGTPGCTHPSEEWREAEEERRARIAGLLENGYTFTVPVAQRWSWTKLS